MKKQSPAYKAEVARPTFSGMKPSPSWPVDSRSIPVQIHARDITHYDTGPGQMDSTGLEEVGPTVTASPSISRQGPPFCCYFGVTLSQHAPTHS